MLGSSYESTVATQRAAKTVCIFYGKYRQTSYISSSLVGEKNDHFILD